MLGSTHHLHHLLANELAGGRVLQQLVGLGVQGYGHTIERHVPDGLLPSCLMIFHQTRLYAGLAKLVDHGLHQCLVTARVVGQVDAAITLVTDKAGLGLGGTDEGQSGSELHTREHLLHILLNPNAVLDEHHQRLTVK